jgi:hypothetical protein
MMRSFVKQKSTLPPIVAAVTLLAILAAPALYAAPLMKEAPRSTAIFDPVGWLGHWFDDVTTGLETVWKRSGCKLDPNGGACAEDSTASEAPPEPSPDAEARPVRDR